MEMQSTEERYKILQVHKNDLNHILKWQRRN